MRAITPCPLASSVEAVTATGHVDNETPALARAWHAVLVADEVGTDPVAVDLLGQPWVVARLGGELVAFVDRCPHRLAPLSIGTVRGSTLQCRYHGWAYEASGACVAIPSLGPDASIPPKAVVRRAAGVAERYGLIWLSPEPPLFDLPDVPEWDDPAFVRAMNAPRLTTVSAGQLVDNFLDATHLRTVHAGTFGVDDGGYLPPADVVRDGWRAHTTFDVQYRNVDDPLVATGAHPLVQPQRLYKEIAGPTSALVRLYHPLTDRTVTFLFACSPQRLGSTRIFKLMARDDVTEPDSQLPEMLDFEDRVLDEDLAVLEPYREMTLRTDPRDEVSVRSDRLSVAYRRMLGDLLAHDGEVVPA